MAICNMKPVAGQFTTNVSVPNLILSLRPCLEKNPATLPHLASKKEYVRFMLQEKEWLLSVDVYVYIFIYNIWVHNMIDKAKNCQTILEVIFPAFHSFTTSFLYP